MAKLLVVPTSRARRELFEDGISFGTKILTTAEFLSRISVVPDKTIVDKTTATLLLRIASKDPKFRSLNIPDDFLVFLEHAPFFLGFFDELSAERADIDDLFGADSYAEYDQHIELITELEKSYNKLLADQELISPASFYREYQLNRSYIDQFDSVRLFAEGAMSAYEREVFDRVAEIVPFEMALSLSSFDSKSASYYQDIELELNATNRINLTNRELISSEPFAENKNRQLLTTANRFDQALGVMDQIERLTAKGIAPEKIVVVLPDESFAKILSSVDTNRNLNYSMGLGFENSTIFTQIELLYVHLTSSTTATELAYKRLAKNDERLTELESLIRSENEIEKILDFIESMANDEERELIKEAIFESKILAKSQHLSHLEAIYLLLAKLKEIRVDDIDGGKITVTGVLETRQSCYDGVIVVDFNEEFVPAKSSKDLFLNTAVRKAAKMPTVYDRANLQRGFYDRLFRRAEEVVIFAVSNDTVAPSRFAKELGLLAQNYEPNLKIFADQQVASKSETEIELEINLADEKLSASKLKTYLSCKRKFYYQYIKQYKNSSELDSDSLARDMGITLHEMLSSVVDSSFVLADELFARIENYLANKLDRSYRAIFEKKLSLDNLRAFCELEAERKKSGFLVHTKEESFSFLYQNIGLVGRIDRVDQNSDQVLILDYKTGKIPAQKSAEKMDDFQMVFYYLAYKAKGFDEIRTAYYDLKEAKIVDFEINDELIAIFDQRLEEFCETHQTFAKSESLQPCRFCDYKLLCGRVL